jgi:hypothetical protein
MNKDLCSNKACHNYGKYGRYCGHLEGKSAKPTAIPARSQKLAEIMKKDYVPKVKEMVAAGTKCKAKTPDCTKIAQGFHHPNGRIGELLLDEEKMPCCNACNLWIEKNDAAARSLGLKKSKFSIPAKNQKIKRAGAKK